MSKPTRGTAAKPAWRAACTAPTMPPAGPDRMVSLASSWAEAARPPLDCITRSRVAPPSACSTWVM